MFPQLKSTAEKNFHACIGGKSRSFLLCHLSISIAERTKGDSQDVQKLVKFKIFFAEENLVAAQMNSVYFAPG